MSKMNDNLEGLLGLQQALNDGLQVGHLGDNYIALYDKVEGKDRFWFAKVINGEVLSLATFREEEPQNGVSDYSINYSVPEKHRGKGLALQVVNKGIGELKTHLKRPFFVDAIIDETNTHSINVAKKIFSGNGDKIKDHFTGAPSIIFHKLIKP